MPKVSVIIPTFNRPELLLFAVKSVLNQTYDDFEVIIVDDGVEKRADKIISEIKDPRVRYIQHERSLGGGSARNTGIKNARGQFLAFLDDDDEWVREKLSIQMKSFENTPKEVGFCFSGVKNIFDDHISVSKVYDGIVDYYETSLTRFKGVLTVTLIVKRYVFDDVGFFDTTLPSHQEAELIIRISKKYKGLGINQPLVNVLMKSGHSQIGKNLDRKIKGRELTIEKHKQEIEKYPEKLAKHYFWLALLHRDNGNMKKAIELLKMAMKTKFKLRYFLHFVNLYFFKKNIELKKNKRLGVAFVVGSFPEISETFIINQVADLLRRGTDVNVFSLKYGNTENISERYYEHSMKDRCLYLSMPENLLRRFFVALPKAISILVRRPRVFFRIFNIKKYGKNSLSLKILFWVYPFVGRENDFDLIHCHFGTVANKFLVINEILGWDKKIIVTFYGYDVSHIFKDKPSDYYDNLKKIGSLFFVMSQNMKERVVSYGFPEEKVEVLPVSIDVPAYDFKERTKKETGELKIISVGRFVEKKGFDDLLKAIAIVKEKINKKITCDIVGGGEMENELRNLTLQLGLEENVNFKGYMKIEDIIKLFEEKDVFIQPSKTARNGDME